VTRPLPPAVTIDLEHDDLRAYWLRRAAQHTQDVYAGVAISKFPEDLRTYEHLLWLDAPDTVIEIGSQFGGSSLWFRDRLALLRAYGRIDRAPRVISVDLDMAAARRELTAADPSFAETIDLLEGDVRDPAMRDRVSELLGPDARCLVVEDSAHMYDTTIAALNGFAQFVAPGGFFVVEDGCVDVETMRLDPSWPRGVLPAVRDWLASPAGAGFTARRDLELYGITCHPSGFLQRTG
jgi:cephalosporin hydroxylase